MGVTWCVYDKEVCHYVRTKVGRRLENTWYKGLHLYVLGCVTSRGWLKRSSPHAGDEAATWSNVERLLLTDAAADPTTTIDGTSSFLNPAVKEATKSPQCRSKKRCI